MQKLIKVTELATIGLVASLLLTGAVLANATAAHGEEQVKDEVVLAVQEPVVAEVIISTPHVPTKGELLLAAARTQLGTYQDCTALVEKSLRSLGYAVGDLGPMDFGSYGVRVSTADAQPGDIMMRWGHVAIYAGNGAAVQGGFNGGNTVETLQDSSPYRYSVIIRLS